AVAGHRRFARRPAGPLGPDRGAAGDPTVPRGARRPGFGTDPDRSRAAPGELPEDGGVGPRRPVRGHQVLRGNPQGVTCSHPNNDPIIKLAAELQAIIYIHTWMIV